MLEQELAAFGGSGLISASLSDEDRKLLQMAEEDLQFYDSNNSQEPPRALLHGLHVAEYEYSTEELKEELGIATTSN